jgi:DNA repair protein RecN (Recombination protein N)
MAALIVDEKTYLQQLELLQFQASEIREARLEAGEDEQLNQEYSRASNSRPAAATQSSGAGSAEPE